MTTAASDQAQYHLTLSDGVNTVGLMLRSEGALRRLPRSQGVERKVERQTTWAGGRGADRFVSDASRFSDSGFAWTMQHGYFYPAPLMHYSQAPALRRLRGYWPGHGMTHALQLFQNLDAVVAFRPLLANELFASQLAGLTNYTVSRIKVIVRGNSDIAVHVRANSGGLPGAILASGTASATTGPLSRVIEVVLSTPVTLPPAANPYFVTIANVGGGEIWAGVGVSVTEPGYYSSDNGSTWSTTPGRLHFLAAENPPETQAECYFFEYKWALYCYRNSEDGRGRLLLNGDRGILSGDTGTVLTDATKNWQPNFWSGCYVVISGNSNYVGHARRVTGSTATTLSIDRPFPELQTNAEYVIVGSNYWQERDDGTNRAAASSPVVCSDFVYIPMGNAETIRRYREYNNAGVWTIQNSPDAHNAHFLIVALSPENTLSIWRFTNNDPLANRQNTWARADAVTSWTNLTFGSIYPLGDNAGTFQSVALYDGKIYVGRSDSIWGLANDGAAVKIPVEMTPVRRSDNTRNMRGWNTNLYFPVLNGFERLYGSVVDDIGPNRDNGLPTLRKGRIVDFVPVLGHGYVAIDAMNNYSTIMATISPGGGWHEIYRAPKGERIRSLYYQPMPDGAPNRLWFSQGNDICFLPMPQDMLSPLNDIAVEGMLFHWEAYVTTSWFDFGSPSLDHFFDRLTFSTDYLDGFTILGNALAGSRLAAYYQVDTGLDIEQGDAVSWTNIGSEALFGTYNSLPIGPNHNVTGRRIRFLLRLNVSSAGGAAFLPRVRMMELRANEINEVLYDYNLDIRIEDRIELLNGQQSTARAQDILSVLESWQTRATPLTMRSIVPVFDNIRVNLDPLSVVPVTFERGETRLVGGLSLKQI